MWVYRSLLRLSFIGLIASAAPIPADGPLVPITPCEILRDLPAQEGKSVAVLGRYSYRSSAGRWVGEQACEPTIASPPVLWLVEDSDGPKPPSDFELDGQAVHRKLAAVGRRTELAKFRFGTSDYDRWAVVYGRVEARKGDDAKKAPANLVFRGSGVIVFVSPQQ